MRKITQTIVGTTPPLDKNVIWLDNTDSTAPVEKVFINGEWTPMGVDTDDYYTKEEVDDKLDEKLNVIENPVNGNLVTMNSQGQVTNSGKKTIDFIANPTDSGSEGEVLSVDSEGNPIWTTVTPTGTADTEMSDTSTNAVQNKVIKEYVDNNYARKDGYYSQLTAGSAENLVGQTVDSEAYLIRPTGGESNEVANGVASVLGMEGNSCVWNQLASLNINDYDYNLSLTHPTTVGNGFHIVFDSNSQIFLTKLKGLASHKYYLYYKIVADKIVTIYENESIIDNVDNEERRRIIVGNNTKRLVGIVSKLSNTIVDYTLQIFDLTLLGIDNLTTTAQVEAWLAQHVGTKPYYAYNPGTILSAQTLGIKTYGQNLLNPTTRQAKLIPYTWVEDGTTYSNQYTIKNVPSGATATFTPDNTGVAETVDISGGTLDITSYGSGVLELSAATANTYVCMKWDGQKDDDVVPFEDHTQDFDVRKVYGKVSGAGEYVQCYPNGMRSAGSVHDTLTASEAVEKTHKVDLSTRTIQTRYTGSINKTISFNLPYAYKKGSINILSQTFKYIRDVAGASELRNPDTEEIGLYTYNNAQASPENVMYIVMPVSRSLTSNDIIVYNRYTYGTYTDLIYRDNGVDRPLADVLMNITINNWSMEEQLMTPYEDGNPTSIPATIKTQYGMDAVEAIDTLQKTSYFTEDVHANLQALLTCINTNCAETLGGTFSISDTATDKVFAFSFTPNVEPTNEGE